VNDPGAPIVNVVLLALVTVGALPATWTTNVPATVGFAFVF
jgi:hypothetical protein